MRTNISPTVRPYESLHLHSCCELENIRDRLASPWGQTVEIASPSSPPPTGPGPHCLQHHNWTQRKTRPRDGCTELKKGGEGEGKKREDARESISQGWLCTWKGGHRVGGALESRTSWRDQKSHTPSKWLWILCSLRNIVHQSSSRTFSLIPCRCLTSEW